MMNNSLVSVSTLKDTKGEKGFVGVEGTKLCPTMEEDGALVVSVVCQHVLGPRHLLSCKTPYRF